MKKILITSSLLLGILTNIRATNLGTYYVYFETEYLQGPWSKVDVLESSSFKYLEPRPYEDLFGSEDTDLINKMIFRLRESKPNIYNWTYDIMVRSDTVVFNIDEDIELLETIKNEVTATLVFNNFKAVLFVVSGKTETVILEDLTIPYFDLIGLKQKKDKLKEVEKTIKKTDSLEIVVDNELDRRKSPLIYVLVLSVIMNIGFIIVLIVRYKRTK